MLLLTDVLTKSFFCFFVDSSLSLSPPPPLLVHIGLLIPEVSIAVIFTHYADKQKHLNVESFVSALDDMSSLQEDDDFSPSTLSRDRRSRGGTNENVDNPKFLQSTRTDDISKKILSEYDEKMKKTVQMAFDNADTENNDVIPAWKLERVMSSLGYDVDYDDLLELLGKIDKREKGMLEYHDFFNHVVTYIRNQYPKTMKFMVHRLERFFNQLDYDGDGLVTKAEFTYITQNLGADLDNEEIEALLSYLDADSSGDIQWEEFQVLANVFKDNDKIDNLNRTLRRALRKIQYATLPNPRKYLTMFFGLPQSYTKSVLAKVNLMDRNRIENIITAKVDPLHKDADNNDKNRRNRNNANMGNASFSDPTGNTNNVKKDVTELNFMVTIDSVTGVPHEEAERYDDVISRGLRFCVVQTDKIPTHDSEGNAENGNPPIFLSNVAHVPADLKDVSKNAWSFGEVNEGTVFIRAKTDKVYQLPSNLWGDDEYDDAENVKEDGKDEEGYDGQSTNIQRRHQRNRGDPMKDLYLYVELNSTFRCRQGLKLNRKGNIRSESVNQSANRREASKRDGKGKENKDTNKDNKSKKSTGLFSYFSRSKSDDTKSRSTARGRSGGNRNSRRGDNSDSDDESDHSRDHDSDRERSERDDSGSPIRRSRDGNEDIRGSRDRDMDRRRSRDDDDDSDHDDDDEAAPCVEMTSAWVFIPISSLLYPTVTGVTKADTKIPIEAVMSGGSPFNMVRLEGKARTGLSTLASTFGYTVSPKILGSITAIPTPEHPWIDIEGEKAKLRAAAAKKGLMGNPQDGNNDFDSNELVANDVRSNGALVNTFHENPLPPVCRTLFSILPDNVILPVKSVIILGLFRQLLQQASENKTLMQTNRLLPQSGINATTDILLSAFPALLTDEAACSVMYTVWSLEAPHQINGVKYAKRDLHTLNTLHLSNPTLLTSFRNTITRYISLSFSLSLSLSLAMTM
jgi:Ca2+-binding EF-hand superfamily protein